MRHIELDLTDAEASAILRAQLSMGFGVRRSVALVNAERKLADAILATADNVKESA